MSSPKVWRGRVGGADACLTVPDQPPRCAVLVLAGSSGRIDEARVRTLSEVGAIALGLRWFGGEGQPSGICEVPLETFAPALDLLAAHDLPLVIVGASKGAEVALLLAVFDPRVRAVAAFAPTDVVWANIGTGRDGRDSPPRSSWSQAGRPLPFVPLVLEWQPDRDPPAFLGWYLRSRQVYAEEVAQARIALEQFDGHVLLVAGGDDRVWDSAPAARRIQAHRAEVGRPTTVVIHPHAGHRTPLPGEPPVAAGQAMQRGGTAVADGQLGAAAWTQLLATLDRLVDC